jgi:molybdenum cofactor cytidylyltransferase
VRGRTTSFVGGGGKTSAILRLAEEFRETGWRVLVTTTTKVGRSIADILPPVLASEEGDAPALLLALERTLEEHGRVFLAAGTDEQGKFTGVEPALCDRLAERLALDAVLVEADGSRQRPLKAPAEHEPVLPPRTELVVPVAGLDALGHRLGPEVVHRPELVSAIVNVGIDSNGLVTPELVASLISSPLGGLKSVPLHARVRPVLNKMVETSLETALRTAKLLVDSGAPGIDRVVVSDVLTGRFGYVERG